MSTVYLGHTYGLHLVDDARVRYVGQTYDTIAARFGGHKRAAYKHNLKYPVYDWMRKHGEKNITYTWLESLMFEDRQDLHDAEAYWICTLETHITSTGLNLSYGGQGTSGLKLTEEQLARHASRTNPEAFAAVSRRTFYSENGLGSWLATHEPTFLGRTHTEQARQRMSQAWSNNSDRTPPPPADRARGRYSMHVRWHVNRSMLKQDCEYCGLTDASD